MARPISRSITPCRTPTRAPARATQRLYAYTVREFDTADGKKGRTWTRIGVAFLHEDGTGFNVVVHSFPPDGRLVLFPADLNANTDDDDTEAGAEVPPVRHAAATGRNGQQQRRR